MRRGFTLIELLVVITIIVVLLSLLAPALDKAIYQAELAMCGARLNALGGGVAVYTMDFNRHYPHRPSVAAKTAWQMRQLTDPNANVDERLVLRGRIALKLVQCPLSEQLDLEPPPNAPVPGVECWQYASYDLWYGWKYEGDVSGMLRLGDHWEWGGRSYAIVAGDFNLFHIGNPFVISSHPDYDGKLPSYALRREYPGVSNPPAALSYNYSDWRRNDKLDRGKIDQNHLYADGSVVRSTGVGMLDDGDRRSAVPWASYNGGVQAAGWQLWVPNP